MLKKNKTFNINIVKNIFFLKALLYSIANIKLVYGVIILAMRVYHVC